jgi:hypothetical protein
MSGGLGKMGTGTATATPGAWQSRRVGAWRICCGCEIFLDSEAAHI